jgi:hypothetical protein
MNAFWILLCIHCPTSTHGIQSTTQTHVHTRDESFSLTIESLTFLIYTAYPSLNLVHSDPQLFPVNTIQNKVKNGQFRRMPSSTTCTADFVAFVLLASNEASHRAQVQSILKEITFRGFHPQGPRLTLLDSCHANVKHSPQYMATCSSQI